MEETRLTPTLAEVQRIAAGGEYRRVPVRRELLADQFTTIEVMRRLRAASHHVFLLESAEADQRSGRWSFLGFDPSMEITCLDDLKGKKVRASTTYAMLVQELGGSPVQMSGGDIYMGMKLGTIDGYIYSVAELETSSLKEVTKYVMQPAGCAGAPCNFLFSMKAWESLTPELQEKVNQALEDSFVSTMEAAAEIDEDSLAKAQEYGVEFAVVEGDALQAFYDAGDKVLASLEEQYPEAQKGFDILKAWKAAQ